MTDYREILRLHSLGISNKQIADSGLCARQTVVTTLQKAEQAGLKWPLEDNLTNEVLARKYFSKKHEKDSAYEMPDCEWIHEELKKPNVTLTLLWYEYYSRCIEEGKLPYKVTQFKKYYSDYAQTQNLTMHLEHKPGEMMQVDWAGDTLKMIDTRTGELIDLYLFVCTLPSSGYTYCEVFSSMNLASWITAHVHTFAYFGGTPNIIQCDNLKTGVVRHGKDEIELNKTYREMAEHYNVAILPGRVRKPKDKAHVEGAVGIASTWILAALRNRQLLTERDAKAAVWENWKNLTRVHSRKKRGAEQMHSRKKSCFSILFHQGHLSWQYGRKPFPG